MIDTNQSQRLADARPRFLEPDINLAVCNRCRKRVTDFMVDRYDPEIVICERCLTEAEETAGTVNLARRLEELEEENAELRHRVGAGVR